MRLLLDTHAFLWLVAGDERLPMTARALIDASEEVLLSSASVWEAEIKRAAGRLEASPIADAAERARIRPLAITSDHATAAAHLPPHHRDPFDRMLVAQARAESLVIVSKDEAVRRYGVAVAW
ncbi:MAG: type II toxin-antitoxin system VapC family toxin [Actinomycetota bacterium]|nr:type II toxin-antitoxin system VapC family toxin [Actinomycetota bacterium]